MASLSGPGQFFLEPNGPRYLARYLFAKENA